MADWNIIHQYFKQMGLHGAVSPLHDRDTKAEHIITDGEGHYFEANYKKAHYHILIAFGNTTTFNHVFKHCKALGFTMPIIVSSVISYYRYLQHLDEDPEEKAIYSDEPIVHINGFDLAEYAIEDKKYRMLQYKAVEKIIDDSAHNCNDIWQLETFLKKYNMDHELCIVYQNEQHFKNYCYYKLKNIKSKRPDKISDTGIIEEEAIQAELE